MAVITGTTDGIEVLAGARGLLFPIIVMGSPGAATIVPLGDCFVTTSV